MNKFIASFLGYCCLFLSPGIQAETESAIFAGGCFWCLEKPFDQLEGVSSTISGYSGGDVDNPTYQQVSNGGTGHKEVVRVTYDPAQVSYERLLEVFWVNIDPIDGGGQFCDRGSQYTSAIFYLNESQRKVAENSFNALVDSARFKQPIQTQLLQASEFYSSEDYHQDYYLKNPIRYKYYRYACGRDTRLQEVWGG